MKNAEELDAELHSFAALSITTGLGVAGFGAATLDGPPLVAALTMTLGALLFGGGVGSFVSARAFDLAAVGWVLLLGLACWVRDGWVVAVVPAMAVWFALIRRSFMRGRLRAVPEALGFVATPTLDLHHCEVCGAAAHGLIAPRVTVSWGFGSALLHFRFRVRCLKHARLRAVPASVISAVFGWWGLRGLVRTPRAIFDNVTEGGVHADDAAVEAAEQEARLGWRAGLPVLVAVGGLIFALFEGYTLVAALSARLSP